MTKGKNFSANNASGKRREADFYETPYSLTRLLLQKITPLKGMSVLEPSCGNGAIVKVLKEEGFKNITAYDLKDGTDFLQETRQFDLIYGNPPYSKAFEFIQKAKRVARHGFYYLLPLSYLHGKQRYDEIYNRHDDYRLKHVFVFTRYPMLGEPLREDGKIHTGFIVFAWFHWVEGYDGQPSIDFLDNHPYILKKGE